VPPPASLRRAVAGVVAAGLVSAYGAAVLGEYELGGFTPLYAGALFGLVVAEVLLVVGRVSGTAGASAAAFLAYGGMALALVLSTVTRDLSYVQAEGWVGAVIAAAVAWSWVRTAVRRGGRTRRGS
jgi:ABC-type Mn2+/Zn2+ transport system permease subunit